MKIQIALLLLAMGLVFTGGFYAGTSSEVVQTGKIKAELHPSRAEEINMLLKEVKEKKKPSSKVVMGYVQDHHDPLKLNYQYLTHVIFSFAHPTADGDLLFSGDHAQNNLRQTVKLAQDNDTKVLLAVGGWFHIEGGATYPYFKEAISNEDTRTTLVTELLEVVNNENLDGVDIDFEHPRSLSDAENLASFMKELNSKLKDYDKELSIAVYSKIDSVTGQENKSVVFLPSMFRDVDYVNIMAYDGQWDGSYNAANLSPYSFTENIVQYWSRFFDDNDLPTDKLVLGVPFYAQPEDPSEPAVSFSTIIDKGTENADRDVVTIDGLTYHYNGKSTIQRKTELAMLNEFGGMMIWEAGHDAKGTHSLAKVISEVVENKAERESKLF
ncbi:MAG: glycoside hydrolase family 18 protein [Bacillota bacterium]